VQEVLKFLKFEIVGIIKSRRMKGRLKYTQTFRYKLEGSTHMCSRV